MRREDITDVLGPVDDALIAEINRIGPSRAELAEAWTWVTVDEALINEGRPLPSGRVAELVALLEALEEDTPE
jgi:hypothetical protein